MQLNAQQLTVLAEMGIPIWQLRTTDPVLEQHVEDQDVSSEIAAEVLTKNWLVLVDDVNDNSAKRSLLDNMLKAIKVAPDNVAIVTTKQYQQLEQIPSLRRVLLVLGDKAAELVLGSQQSLEQYRGSIQQAHIDAVISFDLDDLLANPQKKALAWQDLMLAKRHFEQQVSH